MKCKAERPIADARTVVMRNGRDATRGRCPVCGTGLYRLGREEEMMENDERARATRPYENYDDHTLAVAYVASREALDEQKRALAAIEAELLMRMRVNDARALLDDEFAIEMKAGAPTYDMSELAPLLEVLPADDLAKAYKAEHTEVVAAKWDGGQLNRIERAYGGEIGERVRRARIPGADRVSVERRGRG